jgi:hypothetical protein
MQLELIETGEANIYHIHDTDEANWLMVIQVNGELSTAAQKELLTKMIKNHQTKD